MSGQKVSSIVRRDGAGHQADPNGVAELERRQLVTTKDDFLHFSPEAEEFLQALIASIRGQFGQ